MAGRAASHVRAIAALIVGCCVLAGGIVERWHLAETPHVVDRGVVAHASETDCHSDTAPTHLHQLPGQDHEAGTCALLALHQIAAAGVAPVAAVVSITHVTLQDPAVTAEPRSDLLLAFAPKTSPPAA